jgi:3-oxoacyl-[acyl-carrier protein] reductase
VSGRLEGRVALVTGASRGIGREIARAVAAEGAEVVVAARGIEGACAIADEIVATRGRATPFAMDISSDESVGAAVEELKKAYDTIPLLVNNAGIVRDNLILRMKQHEWDEVIGTNLTGIYRLCRALVPSMVRARFGRIVNITSVVGRVGNPGQTNYAAAKAGVEGLTRSLARELSTRNITVNCVAPGFIDTDMTRELSEEAREKLLSQVPMGRLGTPADVASAVLFLLGEGAAYVTGTTIDVNGGMYI